MQKAFPGDTVDKNPPANAGNAGLIPGPGGFHNAMGELSLCTTTETVVYSPRTATVEPMCHNY